MLRSLNVEVENLVIHRLNFEQMVISSIKKSNHTHLYNCVKYDKKLLKLYDEALAFDKNALFLNSIFCDCVSGTVPWFCIAYPIE